MNSIIQLRHFVLVFIFVIICSSCEAINSQIEHLPPIPNLVGAKLVGIFEDEHKPDNSAHKYSMQAQQVKQPKKLNHDRSHIDPNKLHFCEENIFENGTMHSVPTREPRCSLGHDYSDQEVIRRKRDTKSAIHLANHFVIPAGMPKEEIADDSYIKLQLRVCSQPNGEVLVFDLSSRRILNKFKNGGTAYQCNQWTMDFEKSISDSSKIQVEYRLPDGEDYDLSNVNYEFVKHDGDQGNRTIQYKRAIDDVLIFQLELKYNEIKFIYDKPTELRPVGDSEIGPIEAFYQPNLVKTYILLKRSLCDVGERSNCQDKFFVGISVEILELDLDFDRGDYILVGPGERPEFWKNSKGQMIAQRIKETDSQKHKIWINADSAFISLVTHNSLTEPNAKSALKFKWTPGNTTLNDFQLGEVSQLLKEASIQLCFAGYECNYYKTVDTLFIEEAVHIFNHYLIDHEDSVTTLINHDSVQIFDMEPIFYNKGHFTEQYCQFHLAISSPYDNEYPLVQSDVLKKMFFGNSNSRKMIGQKITVNNCVFQRISWATILIPIGTIILLSVGIMIVFWRMQSRMLQKNKSFNVKNKESLERLQPVPKQFDDAMQY